MQRKLRYDMIGAGPIGHPQEIMKKVSEVLEFKILSGEGHPIGDCWTFEIETENDLGYLPCYIYEIK